MAGGQRGERQQRTSISPQLTFHSFPTFRGIPASSTGSEIGSRDGLHLLDCNLGGLCEHIQVEGWNVGAFSDVVIQAMGSTYYLHRLILSRSSYFRHMLKGPWKEADAPEVTLQIDDTNVNAEALHVALAYLYGHYPKLNDSNAFRVLAAGCFLDLEDLCTICTDFIISDLHEENFLTYQAFAESQDYGIYGERVRKACWGYLCRGAAAELKEILPKLSRQTLRTVLTSDELWVPSEGRRFELALSVLIARGIAVEHHQSAPVIDAVEELGVDNSSSLSLSKMWKDELNALIGIEQKSSSMTLSVAEQQCAAVNCEVIQVAQNLLIQLTDSSVGFHRDNFCNSSSLSKDQGTTTEQVARVTPVCESEKLGSPDKCQIEMERRNTCSPLIGIGNRLEVATGEACSSQNSAVNEFVENHLNCHDVHRIRDQVDNCSSIQVQVSSSGRGSLPDQWSKDGSYVAPAWGGRVVGRRQVKSYPNQCGWVRSEDWDTFVGIFEEGGILYCHITFEELLNVRGRLEEFGFPCKAVCDGLWLQTLLRQHILTIAADLCKTCGLCMSSCACRWSYSYPRGRNATNFHKEDQDKSTGGSCHVADAHAVFSGAPPQGRVHVRGGVDGLAAVVGLSQGNSSGVPVHSDQSGNLEELHYSGRVLGEAGSAVGFPVVIGSQKGDTQNHALSLEWEMNGCLPIALDLDTPLRTFPPFRFGVEFDNVHRLGDGQSKHSPEAFYAGSLWKISVQAFHDEDPQCRRTLGLFLHRRRAENVDTCHKVYLYPDTREKVTARYQLICPSKREVTIFGSITQAGTLLPKAPKGWGWRTAFLFDELADLFQGGSLRVAAVVQLV